MNGADSYFWSEDPLPYVERKPLMLFIGVDPGVSGGIACIDDHAVVHGTFKMPETDRDLWDLLDEIDSRWHHPPVPVRAVLEKVNPGVFGRPGAKMGVVSAFTFGGNYRALKMALTAADIPFDEVLPVKWQTELSCRSRGDKNITKARAQQLYPQVKVTHAIADALLLAEYGRRTEQLRGSRKGESDGKEGTEEKVRIEEGFYTNREDAHRAEAVAKGRREGAARRADPPAPATGTVARRRRGSRLEGDR